jgi:hypothetical protein
MSLTETPKFPVVSVVQVPSGVTEPHEGDPDWAWVLPPEESRNTSPINPRKIVSFIFI